MEAESAKIIKVNSTGNHHHASLLINPSHRKVSAGTVLNYSDNGLIGIKINAEGRAIGTFAHSGNTHYLRGELDSDGRFRGSFLDKQSGVEIAFSSDKSQLMEGNLPTGSLEMAGEHYSTSLALDGEGNISGNIESQLTPSSAFRIEMRSGRVCSGVVTHNGEHHTTSISLDEANWGAEISSDDDDMRWSIGIEKGIAGMRGDIKFKHSF
ncbi:hypothetical protein C7271_16725 [filamentous cyanobacterium CCP5]|nr:hypothetical protein C7271_16725 [filamentous cyanobacterium CCP5]